MSTATVQITIDADTLALLVKQNLIKVAEKAGEIIATTGATLATVKRVAERYTDPKFALFYGRYPRKVGVGAAWKAWQAALKRGNTAEEILSGYDPAAIQRKAPYIVNPSTWLNQDRWLDEPENTETIHDQMREALMNELRATDASHTDRAERLLSSVSSPPAISDRRSAIEEDPTDCRGNKLRDPFGLE